MCLVERIGWLSVDLIMATQTHNKTGNVRTKAISRGIRVTIAAMERQSVLNITSVSL